MPDVNAIESYSHAPVEQWQPVLPEGRIDRLYLHWSAHDYFKVFPAYHVCVATDSGGGIVAVQTHDLKENMRDVSKDPEAPYAAHTRGRNSFAAGLSIMGMEGARPEDFGPYPLTEGLIHGLCVAAARLAAFYGVPCDRDHVMTHAEAGVAEGYFGNGEGERWDIARLRPAPGPLVPADAAAAGDELRRRIATCLK